MLVKGATKSCPACRYKKSFKHGHCNENSRTYRIWSGMRRRCNPNAKDQHPRYAGRGIKIADRWADFRNFLADMGECPPNLSLDRIDNNGDYTPANCRWASQKQQCRNHRRNLRITAFGETKTAAEWLEDSRCKCSNAQLYSRIGMGWSAEDALTLTRYSHPNGPSTRRQPKIAGQTNLLEIL